MNTAQGRTRNTLAALALAPILGLIAGAVVWALGAVVYGGTAPAQPLIAAVLVCLLVGWFLLGRSARDRVIGVGAAVVASVLLALTVGIGFLVASSLGSTTVPQYGEGAVRLPSGNVLVMGGDNGRTFPDNDPVVQRTALLYHPATKSWSATGALPAPRERFTAVRLRRGKVLLAGGSSSPIPGGASAQAFLYDPRTGTMHLPRESRPDIRINLESAVLGNGTVLVLGGVAPKRPDADSAELYNPSAGRWSRTAKIRCGPDHPFTVTALMALPSGDALAFCVSDAGTIRSEIYNPATGAWKSGRAVQRPRYRYSATLLPGGRVLLAAGSSDRYGNHPEPSTVIYDPAHDTWSPAGDLHTPRTDAIAVALARGDVLLAGGYALVHNGRFEVSVNQVTTAEVFHPARGTWSATGAMREPLASQLILLKGGTVLAVGGAAPELYDPRTGAWSEVAGSAIASWL